MGINRIDAGLGIFAEGAYETLAAQRYKRLLLRAIVLAAGLLLGSIAGLVAGVMTGIISLC